MIAVVDCACLVFVRAPWQVDPLQMLGAAMTAVNSGVAITFFRAYLPGQPGTATNLYSNALQIGSTAGYVSPVHWRPRSGTAPSSRSAPA